jgi:tetratricopeptide (TPR) repeat protein
VTVADFQAEFDRLKAGKNGVTQDFLRQLLAFVDQGVESLDDRVAAHQLLVGTYEQLGEFDRALTAFGDYIGLVESRAGREQAAGTADAKANALFEGQRDYLRAMAYYDLVATRYPGTPEAQHARFMGGRYFQRQDMWTEAAKEYRRIADELPADSYWKKRATMELSLVLGNAGKPEEGIAVMARFAEEAKDPNDAVYAHFEIGRLYYYMGETHYPDAIKHFRMILDKYAGHGYERDTRRMLVRMQRKIADEMSVGITN